MAARGRTARAALARRSADGSAPRRAHRGPAVISAARRCPRGQRRRDASGLVARARCGWNACRGPHSARASERRVSRRSLRRSGLADADRAPLAAAGPRRGKQDRFRRAFRADRARGAIVAEAREHRGRVVAIGTSVVRALEGAASVNGGMLRACSGETDLLLGPGYQPRVVDGLLTGVHEKGASHYALLRAFAPEDVLARASAHAEEKGYLSHEFGDFWLILGDALSAHGYSFSAL